MKVGNQLIRIYNGNHTPLRSFAFAMGRAWVIGMWEYLHLRWRTAPPGHCHASHCWRSYSTGGLTLVGTNSILRLYTLEKNATFSNDKFSLSQIVNQNNTFFYISLFVLKSFKSCQSSKLVFAVFPKLHWCSHRIWPYLVFEFRMRTEIFFFRRLLILIRDRFRSRVLRWFCTLICLSVS